MMVAMAVVANDADIEDDCNFDWNDDSTDRMAPCHCSFKHF